MNHITRLTATALSLVLILSAASAAPAMTGTTDTGWGPVGAEEEPVPDGVSWSQQYLTSHDGTPLRADVFLPEDLAAGERVPVILSVGAYFSRNYWNGVDPTERGPEIFYTELFQGRGLAERRYALVLVDARGMGGSGGCYDMGGALEQRDVATAIEWAADQEWSTGKVGTWGGSYDAWTQVMALAEAPKGHAAAVIQVPLLELYRGYWMNGVHYAGSWWLPAVIYGGYHLSPQYPWDATPEQYVHPAHGIATNPDCMAMHQANSLERDRSAPYWQERNRIQDAAASTVPVFWQSGFNDRTTRPDNVLPLYSGLRGPKRAWFGQWAHAKGSNTVATGRNGEDFMEQAWAFLDHHLKGVPLPHLPAVEVQDGEGAWRSEAAWPPADARPHALVLRPGSYADIPGNSAGDTPEVGTRGYTVQVMGGQGHWTFTDAAPYDLRFAGTPVVSADIDVAVANANMVALLYDVHPDGTARFITRGATLVQPGTDVDLELYPQDWILRRGHRLGLLLAADDSSWFNPIPTGTTVEVRGGALTLPFLSRARITDARGGRAAAMDAVPTLRVTDEVIASSTVPADWPPPMTSSGAAGCDPSVRGGLGAVEPAHAPADRPARGSTSAAC